MMRTLIPCVVNGQLVDIDEDSLVKKVGGHETATEVCDWVEYWLNDELVHRSVHVHLRSGLGSLLAQGSL